MILFGGHDEFPDKRFNCRCWGAAVIQEPRQLRSLCKALDLKGAVLQGIRFLEGPAFLEYTKENKEYQFAAGEFYKLTHGSRGEKFYAANGAVLTLAEARKLAERVQVPVSVRTREPVFLDTDKGTAEILYAESSSVCLTKSLLPKDLESALRPAGGAVFDTARLFKELQGRQLTDIQVECETPQEAQEQFSGAWLYDLEAYTWYIAALRFVFDNGWSLCFDDDGCGCGWVWLEDGQGQRVWYNGRELAGWTLR